MDSRNELPSSGISDPSGAVATYLIERIRRDSRIKGAEEDALAVEEPLEIRLCVPDPDRDRDGAIGGTIVKTVSLTMRTPGHDAELAAGFLLTEGIIAKASQITRIEAIGIDWLPGESANALQVTVERGFNIDLDRLQRNFYTSSSCGVCGKTSIDAVRTVASSSALGNSIAPDSPFFVKKEVVIGLPERLRAAQGAFEQTGGLHASALFTGAGDLVCAREDVGRHNALDKLIGAEMLAGHLPLRERILLVSGRASFELAQKAVMAGIPVLAAVGAPSSLAVDLAREFNLTLIGFLRGERFNIYSARERIS